MPNTMNGMPGYIDADKSSSMDHVRGGKGVGPKREGPIGHKGGSGAKSMGKGAPGTTTPNYHKSSTGRAGPIEHDTSSGHEHIHIRTGSHRPAPPGKPPPTAHGKLPGGRGGDTSHPNKAKNMAAAVPKGHPGRMEKLAGRAKFHSEGRRKSTMY